MKHRWMLVLICSAMMISACGSPTAPAEEAPATLVPSPTPTAIPIPPSPPEIPYELIDMAHVYGYLEELTAIQPYSGWRSPGTEGEAEALDAVAGWLAAFPALQSLGLELERQSFQVYNSTELWETRLVLTVDGQETEVNADGIIGYRDNNYHALRFDSDGELNDVERDPMLVEGPVLLVRSYGDVQALSPADVEGRVVVVDYAAVDRVVLDAATRTFPLPQDLLALQPAGILLVTQFSNVPGESHGSFVGMANPFTRLEVSSYLPRVPILYATLEDMAAAGIEDWEDISRIQSARLVWDADVFSPGTSGNLVARIPGIDPTRAVILGAHIDTPNSPGAFDDGSGSAALMEVARVLDAAQIQPAVDLYLVWFGSEELLCYGSTHFAVTHQELLDRTIGMLQMDMLAHPLDGMAAEVTFLTWPYNRHGEDRLLWTDHLVQLAEQVGVAVNVEGEYSVHSDDLAFVGFGVPSADLTYHGRDLERYNPIHYAAHIHDPYETVALVREKEDVYEQMVRVMLAAAVGVGWEQTETRVAPPADRRVVFVGSHTEQALMTPAGLIDFGLTLVMEGFDVDLVPYGQPVTANDLVDADLVIVLPLVDYPGQAGNATLYDEEWSAEEVAALEQYVAQGGLLVLTNSAHRFKLYGQTWERNEDKRDMNLLAEQFGVTFRVGVIMDDVVWVQRGSHSLVEGVSLPHVIRENGVPFTLENGQLLAKAGDGKAVIGLVDYGDAGGEVLVLADLGLFTTGLGTPKNLVFWQNLAEYVRSR